MSLNIGDLVGYIKLDHTGVGQGIRAAQRDMQAGMGKVQTDVKAQGAKAGKAAGDGLSGGFRGSIGNLAKIAVGAFAVERVVAGLNYAKNAASDLNETTSKSSVIFGQNAEAMKKWAEQGPRALGLSTEASLRAASGFGDMFLQLGFAQDAAEGMSKATVQMAADLGSFNNLGTEDVIDRLSAGFRGEYDSLQLLIPNISAARVEQEALTATGKKSAAALTQQEKAAATLAIVQKDGARASGDFARTRNGEANASKTAAALTEDLAAKFGQLLLPAYTALVVFGRDQVIPFLEGTVDSLGNVADIAGPVADSVGGIVSTFRDLPEPVQASTLGLIALIALAPRISAFGTALGTKVTAGAIASQKALDGVRLGLMYAGDSATNASSRFTAVTRSLGTSAAAGLRGAASGLLGVVGGPWGLAFAGAVTVLGAWLTKQAEAKRRVDSLKESLDQQTGAITATTRANIVSKLEQDGVLKSAQSLGIALDDVTNAILGQADAQDRLNSQLAAASQLTFDGNPEAYEQTGNAIEKVRDAIGGQNDELKASQAQWQREHAAMGTATTTTGKAATAQDGLADSTSNTTGEITEQKTALDKAAKATLDLIDAQIAAIDGQVSYQSTLASGYEVVKEYGKQLPKNASGFKLQTEAGREAQSALADLARDTRSKIEQDRDAGKSLGFLRGEMKSSRADFVNLAMDLGLSRVAAEKMAAKFGLTKGSVDAVAKSANDLPAAKQIKVEAETKRAKDNLDALNRMMNSMDGRTLRITAYGRVVMSSNPFTGGRAMVGGQTIDSADGNILRFANGTEDHRAVVDRGTGPVRVWREPETGGEAYIPLAAAKRSRSTDILSEVAREFGYDLVPAGRASTPAASSSGRTPVSLSASDIDAIARAVSNVNVHTSVSASDIGRAGGVKLL